MADRILVENLVKRFGSVEAVRGVSFQVGAREVFGFLGPNGAGKTTTIKMLSTLLEPTSGHLSIDGVDVMRERQRVRQMIGLVFQEPTLDERLTGWENLLFHGLLYGLSAADTKRRADPLLDMVGLSDRAHSLVRTYSGGMKRRLELVRGLIHRPKVLFLDEPTVGLDPQTRAQVWDYIVRLKDTEDTTIFVTTHYLDEAERCERVAIMDHGQIVALGTPEELKRRLGHEEIRLTTPPVDSGLEEQWREQLGSALSGGEGRWIYQTDNAGHDAAHVVSVMGEAIRQMEIRRPTLEDVFLHLTGREIREEGPAPTMAPPGWRRGR
ncbi:ABC-type multidrug transport system, ATPase component [Sulfobacillus acidophilus TPY]|uniref:Daunorubicin resistance ABC transporter ATPase subunit n=1 Tax=Sulfobacillus acidophilus (strain ATCC 700253 / DSM 10332 / NAL) TaxID=679936 RepID=G8TWM5_SULAD|nr:ABC-type multidrug transport system, ATPase component [Sulfobacillus acidophilus TPY]AEW06014.1 daunorubicin resistance ABC transporter ATPase subunit [Sulfobacillus acidophilus DSM 10332]